jgi:hypothetical protein
MLVLAMCGVAEAALRSTQVTSRQVQIENTICFMLLAFGAGLRGEEVPLVDLGGLLTFWMETREEDDKYMMTHCRVGLREKSTNGGTSSPSVMRPDPGSLSGYGRKESCTTV